MQSQTKRRITVANERIGWFNKAVLAAIKPSIKIDSNSRWPILHNFFASESFGNVLHTTSSLIAVLKVIDSAYKLVDAASHKGNDCDDVVKYFGKPTQAGLEIKIEAKYFNNPENHDSTAALAEELTKLKAQLTGKTGKERKIIKAEIQKIKRQLSLIYFCTNHPEFAEIIAKAASKEEKKAALQKFLEEQIATISAPRESERGTVEKWQNKLVNDLRKTQGMQKKNWRDLVMGVITLLMYAVKPFLWIMGFILSAALISTLAIVFSIASLVIVSLSFVLSCYQLFNEVSEAARAELGDSKQEWSNRGIGEKLRKGFICFWAKAFYADAASNIATLSSYIILPILLAVGITAPSVVVILSIIALVCGLIALLGSLHKKINNAEKIDKSFVAYELLKIGLTAIILAGVSFIALASAPVAGIIVGTVLVCGIAAVVYERCINSAKLAINLEESGPTLAVESDPNFATVSDGEVCYKFVVVAAGPNANNAAGPNANNNVNNNVVSEAV